MKLLPLVVLLFLFACAENQKEDKSIVIVSKEQIEAAASDSNKADCIRPSIDGLLVRSDTAKDEDGRPKPLVKWYDQSGHLLMVEIYDIPSQFRAEKIYDTARHLVYEGVSKGTVKFQCHQYTYNANGQLVSQSGYGTGGGGKK